MWGWGSSTDIRCNANIPGVLAEFSAPVSFCFDPNDTSAAQKKLRFARFNLKPQLDC